MAASSSPSLPAESHDLEDRLEDYRPVSGTAVAGLLVGLGSVVAFIHPLLWLVPLAGAIVNVLALRQVATASPPRIGRKAALIGLACSLVFGISVAAQFGFHRRAVRAEAVAMAEEWFTALRENRPDLAFRLTQFPTTKATRAKPPLEVTGGDAKKVQLARESLRRFTQQSPIGLLLKLGTRAHVRLYQHEDVWRDETLEGARGIYVVTVGQGADAASFFIRLGCSRSADLATGEWQWQVTKNEFISMPSEELLSSLGM